MMTALRYHIFLSPHLDDVVLSCGGLLAKLTEAGFPVTVLSIFTGQLPAESPLSPFAALLHQLWGNPAEAYATRRAEDAVALANFGLTPHWLNQLDCIYRGHANAWFYPDDTALFANVHPAEEKLPQILAGNIQSFLRETTPSNAPLTFYVPLAVGNHVDHQLTNRAVAQLIRPIDTLFFYEDYPYIQRQPDDLERAKQTSRKIWGEKFGWYSKRILLSTNNVQTKLDAIAAYSSQMDILFGGEAAMRRDVSAFFNAEGSPAETLWQKVTN